MSGRGFNNSITIPRINSTKKPKMRKIPDFLKFSLLFLNPVIKIKTYSTNHRNPPKLERIIVIMFIWELGLNIIVNGKGNKQIFPIIPIPPAIFREESHLS